MQELTAGLNLKLSLVKNRWPRVKPGNNERQQFMQIIVKRIKNVGQFGEYPALKNVQTGKIYVDIEQGNADNLKPDSNGENRFGHFVAFNIPGAWHSFHHEPECPLRRDIQFVLVEAGSDSAEQSREELKKSLNSFNVWMNRPVKRIHVYSWRLALTIEPADAPACGIRILPAYRHLPGVQAWRNGVAAILKQQRQAGKIELPTYDEQTAEYSKPSTLRFVTRAQAVAEGFNFRTKTNQAASLEEIAKDLRSEGYSEIVIAKDVAHITTPAGTSYLFFVKHPAVNP